LTITSSCQRETAEGISACVFSYLSKTEKPKWILDRPEHQRFGFSLGGALAQRQSSGNNSSRLSPKAESTHLFSGPALWFGEFQA